jgi:hypothetical protein
MICIISWSSVDDASRLCEQCDLPRCDHAGMAAGNRTRQSLTYEVDALRVLMLKGQTSSFGLGSDFGVLLAPTIVLVIIGARLYPNVVRSNQLKGIQKDD